MELGAISRWATRLDGNEDQNAAQDSEFYTPEAAYRDHRGHLQMECCNRQTRMGTEASDTDKTVVSRLDQLCNGKDSVGSTTSPRPTTRCAQPSAPLREPSGCCWPRRSGCGGNSSRRSSEKDRRRRRSRAAGRVLPRVLPRRISGCWLVSRKSFILNGWGGRI